MTREIIAIELPHFAEQIASLTLTEADKIIAILWFHDHHIPGFEASIINLAQMTTSLTLTSNVNITRLKKNLQNNKCIIRGRLDGYIKIRLAERANLNNSYFEYINTKNPVIKFDLLPKSQTNGVGAFFEALGREINGCYSYEFYDGCAVLCRRMIESLLILTFTNIGHLDKIQNGKDLMMLADIVRIAKSGQYIRLARGTDKSLDLIKEIGDRAAHHRSHVTSRPDIESMAVKFRAVISELINLAGIVPK